MPLKHFFRKKVGGNLGRKRKMLLTLHPFRVSSPCLEPQKECCNEGRQRTNGCFPEWPNGADCKSAVFRLRWFESISTHARVTEAACGTSRRYGVALEKKCGSSSVDRALAFQAGGRGFEPRLPLEERKSECCFSSVVERILGKDEVLSSTLRSSSKVVKRMRRRGLISIPLFLI